MGREERPGWESVDKGERKKPFLLRADEGGEVRGLSSFSRTESRFFRTSSSDGRDWPKPWDEATCSMDLKYCLILVKGVC